MQWESLTPDENIFLLQNSKINSNTQNFDQSKLSATHDNKAIDVNNAPLDKDNSRNHSRIKKNLQNKTNNFNNSRVILYGISRNNINNRNVRKPSSIYLDTASSIKLDTT